VEHERNVVAAVVSTAGEKALGTKASTTRLSLDPWYGSLTCR